VKIDTIIMLVGAFLLLAKPQLEIPWITPPPPVVVPNGPVITPVDGPITQQLAGQPADAAEVAGFFAALAAVVERDSTVLKTNEDFYRGLQASAALMFQG
jgi:hypothetical protein